MRGSFVVGAAIFAASAMAAFASPADQLVPQGATKVMENGNVVEFDIAADPMRVDAFYHKLLPTEGYEVTDDVRSPSAISFFFNRGADSNGSIVIRLRGDVSHVVLTLTE